ncbi:MAG: radical SAM protein [Clostridia bacterium]|nr:radical SAM protein [Clostridia bacterium]
MNKGSQTPAGMALTQKLNHEFTGFFKTAIGVAAGTKGYRIPFIRHFFHQCKAARIRTREESLGTHVPPFLIHSVTQKCNLNCKGCYAKHLHGVSENEFPIEKTVQLFQEAHELGISVIMLAGGEPLMKKGLIGATCQFPNIIFPLFTNGLLIGEEMAREIKQKRNLIPIISLEGDSQPTDERRGSGVYDQLQRTFKILSQNNVLFGVSLTVTRENIEAVTESGFVDGLRALGAKIIFYIEYIPCEKNSESLVLTQEQRALLKSRMESLRKDSKLMFVSFPGDEEQFGGCLAAGRGFVHVGSSGKVEPCPFSPFSDSSLGSVSLREALKSPFLKEIREYHGRLSEHEGGCALWENREWVDKTLERIQKSK